MPDEFDAAMLKKAYRNKVMKFHPDKAKNENERIEFEALMKKLNEANEYLKEYLETHNGKYSRKEETQFKSENYSKNYNEEEYDYQENKQEENADEYETEENINYSSDEFLEENKPKKYIIYIVLFLLICFLIYHFAEKVPDNSVNSNNNQKMEDKVEHKYREKSKAEYKDKENIQGHNDAINIDYSEEISSYMGKIQREIERNWDLPQNIMKQRGYDEIQVVVILTIAKDGRLIEKPKIKKSSGLVIIDRSCIDAIKLTAPFRPLPSFIKDEKLVVEFTFDANRKNN